MADPSPVVGLPNEEYVEIKNRSGKDINLQGWRLVTTTSSSASFTAYILHADSLLVITSISSSSSLARYGKVLGVASFPSLPNNGTTLSLHNKDTVIHSLGYSNKWYKDLKKDDGGWSLEMIDADNPCSGEANWKASTDSKGGTPGTKNSVEAKNEDLSAPALINAYLQDEQTIILQFNEPLDLISPGVLSNYSISPFISFTLASRLLNSDKEVQINLNAPLISSLIYTISVSNIKDCKGNELVKSELKIGLPKEAAKHDLVINEILFNPKPGGVDFVELYNRSKNIIDAGKLFMRNRNTGTVPGPVHKLSAEPRYVFSGDYLLLTEDAASLGQGYFVKNTNAVLTVTSLPSMPDDKGFIVLTDSSGTIIDELSYSDDWQFSLIADDEGVSLERIDPDEETQSQGNWHSAATNVGYATPTYRNSQYKLKEQINAGIEIITKIFSPDNDGIDDVAIISYHLDAPGYVANLKIFDVAGREVRHLVKNNLTGLKGSWTWDGLNEKGQRLPLGAYIIFTELFNLQGKKKQFKSSVVLARRLN